MKHYIFLERVTGSGGVQCYLAAMTRYLEKSGWHVVVISDNNPNNKLATCFIAFLEKYRKNGNAYLSLFPHQLPKMLVRYVLKRMETIVGHVKSGDEVIVESWNSQTAMWGELLAKRINGRHFFWLANEYFRGPGTAYLEKIDFFLFKMKRGELFAKIESANRLFEGYMTYKKGEFRENVINEDPFQDIESNAINLIEKRDWNICYIGRANKPYVKNIIKDIVGFARKYDDKQIQFIMVGDADSCRQELDSINEKNLLIMELGDQYPIPRSLLRKIDVIIAGSGSARHSADEGALTIVADTETLDSLGLLGYDTVNSIYGDDKEGHGVHHFSFVEALERALVSKTWKSQVNRWNPSLGVEESWNNRCVIISEASSIKEYYDENKLLKGRIDYKSLLKFLVQNIKYKFQ